MNVKKRQEIRTKTCTDTDKANILWSLHGIECAVISLFFFLVFYFFFSFFLRVPAVGPAKYVNVAQVASFFSSRLLGNVCANEKKKETPTTYFIKKKTFPTNVKAFAIRPRLAIGNKSQAMFHTSWQNWTIYCLTCFFYAFFFTWFSYQMMNHWLDTCVYMQMVKCDAW